MGDLIQNINSVVMRISEIYFSFKIYIYIYTYDGLTHNLFIIKILGNFVVDLSFKKLLLKKKKKKSLCLVLLPI